MANIQITSAMMAQNQKDIKFLLLLLLVWFMPAKSSSIEIISGVVLDANSGQSVPFANIGIAGTMAGTAADENGFFQLHIEDYYLDFKLRFSAVGFKTDSIPVAELIGKSMVKIVMDPQKYQISTFEISSESHILIGLIKKVIRNISANYIPRAYTYDFKYTERDSLWGETKIRNLTGKILDSKGYIRSNLENAYNEVSFRFDKDSSGYHNYNLYQPLFDDVMSFDIVRYPNNILNEEFLYDFQVDFLDSYSTDDDTIWVIGYKSLSPNLYSTGDAYAEIYEGEIHINKRTSEVLKNVLSAQSRMMSKLGRSVMFDPDLFAPLGWMVKYNAITTYNNFRGGNALNSVYVSGKYYRTDGAEVCFKRNLTVENIEYGAEKNVKGKRDYLIIE